MNPLISGIQHTGAALDAERTRMEVIGSNIANANVSRDIDGKPYQRLQVVFDTVLTDAIGTDSSSRQIPQVRVARVQADTRPPQQLYDPGHPEADPATGMRLMPNINVHEEMADYMMSSRAYEANLAVIKTARAIALQTLSIGKR